MASHRNCFARVSRGRVPSGGSQTTAGSEPEKDQAEALVLTGLLVLKSGRLDWPHRQQESAVRFSPVSVLVP